MHYFALACVNYGCILTLRGCIEATTTQVSHTWARHTHVHIAVLRTVVFKKVFMHSYPENAYSTSSCFIFLLRSVYFNMSTPVNPSNALTSLSPYFSIGQPPPAVPPRHIQSKPQHPATGVKLNSLTDHEVWDKTDQEICGMLFVIS